MENYFLVHGELNRKPKFIYEVETDKYDTWLWLRDTDFYPNDKRVLMGTVTENNRGWKCTSYTLSPTGVKIFLPRGLFKQVETLD